MAVAPTPPAPSATRYYTAQPGSASAMPGSVSVAQPGYQPPRGADGPLMNPCGAQWPQAAQWPHQWGMPWSGGAYGGGYSATAYPGVAAPSPVLSGPAVPHNCFASGCTPVAVPAHLHLAAPSPRQRRHQRGAGGAPGGGSSGSSSDSARRGRRTSHRRSPAKRPPAARRRDNRRPSTGRRRNAAAGGPGAPSSPDSSPSDGSGQERRGVARSGASWRPPRDAPRRNRDGGGGGGDSPPPSGHGGGSGAPSSRHPRSHGGGHGGDDDGRRRDGWSPERIDAALRHSRMTQVSEAAMRARLASKPTGRKAEDLVNTLWKKFLDNRNYKPKVQQFSVWLNLLGSAFEKFLLSCQHAGVETCLDDENLWLRLVALLPEAQQHLCAVQNPEQHTPAVFFATLRKDAMARLDRVLDWARTPGAQMKPGDSHERQAQRCMEQYTVNNAGAPLVPRAYMALFNHLHLEPDKGLPLRDRLCLNPHMKAHLEGSGADDAVSQHLMTELLQTMRRMDDAAGVVPPSGRSGRKRGKQSEGDGHEHVASVNAVPAQQDAGRGNRSEGGRGDGGRGGRGRGRGRHDFGGGRSEYNSGRGRATPREPARFYPDGNPAARVQAYGAEQDVCFPGHAEASRGQRDEPPLAANHSALRVHLNGISSAFPGRGALPFGLSSATALLATTAGSSPMTRRSSRLQSIAEAPTDAVMAPEASTAVAAASPEPAVHVRARDAASAPMPVAPMPVAPPSLAPALNPADGETEAPRAAHPVAPAPARASTPATAETPAGPREPGSAASSPAATMTPPVVTIGGKTKTKTRGHKPRPALQADAGDACDADDSVTLQQRKRALETLRANKWRNVPAQIHRAITDCTVVLRVADLLALHGDADVAELLQGLATALQKVPADAMAGPAASTQTMTSTLLSDVAPNAGIAPRTVATVAALLRTAAASSRVADTNWAHVCSTLDAHASVVGDSVEVCMDVSRMRRTHMFLVQWPKDLSASSPQALSVAFDEGAEVSTISSAALLKHMTSVNAGMARLKGEPDAWPVGVMALQDPPALYAYDGRQAKAATLVSVHARIQDAVYPIKLLVVRDAPADVVLGLNFLMRYARLAPRTLPDWQPCHADVTDTMFLGVPKGRALQVPKRLRPLTGDAHPAACTFTQAVKLRTAWTHWRMPAKRVPAADAARHVRQFAQQ